MQLDRDQTIVSASGRPTGRRGDWALLGHGGAVSIESDDDFRREWEPFGSDPWADWDRGEPVA